MKRHANNNIFYYLRNLSPINFFVILCISFVLNELHVQPEAFITTWKTDNPGATSPRSIIILTVNGLSYDYEVDWNNDGIYDKKGITGMTSHDFGIPGMYTIRIKGKFPQITFTPAGHSVSSKLISIDQWGTISWESMADAFTGCSNLT